MTGHDFFRCYCEECVIRKRDYMRAYRQRPDVRARHNARARANRHTWDSYYYRDRSRANGD